ncbi:sialidase family protein [Coraliomargarita algicola]|uniref:Sialidase family protein n=1 Tax=Coraliomargarita algicola TaxID=3092156 RepID=A0ABZ0RKZ5_9BACT|nr:sialidase family protein [Coraliomargarita sp. J2-16]WPJ96737.1 sialidase family protein [Coraliomargarita sp. J2-16]
MENSSIVFRGYTPIHCCCDATWRRLPNGEQAVFFMTGGNFEPESSNFVVMCRSHDEGQTWGEHEIIHQSEACKADLEKVPHNMDPNWKDRCVPEIATTMSEVIVDGDTVCVYLQIHDGHFGHWRTAVTRSTDNGHTWSTPELFEAKPKRSMIRNLYLTSWGEYLLPYQFQPTNGDSEESFMDDPNKLAQINGVLIGTGKNGPWEQGGEVQGPHGWAEVNVIELSNEQLVMLCRSDEGYLMRSESSDRGRSWTEYVKTDIPNPGSKFRLFKLKQGGILLLHNPSNQVHHPNTKHRCPTGRNPLSIWISNDNMQSWNYQEDVCTFPGALSYPDGEIEESTSGTYLHFAFDYNRHDVIYMKVELPNQ